MEYPNMECGARRGWYRRTAGTTGSRRATRHEARLS